MDTTWENQCKAELIQEIPDRYPTFGSNVGSNVLILRPAVRNEDQARRYVIERAGDILGYACQGGEWCYPLPDGQLELRPLTDPVISDNYSYAQLDGRLVTAVFLYGPDPSGYPGARTPIQTVIVHDTAGILPCPLPLTIEHRPAVGTLTLLPDGGFLAELYPQFDGSHPPVQIREPALVCYGPDGVQRWAVEGVDHVVQIEKDLIHAVRKKDYGSPKHPLVLNMDGTAAAETPAAISPDITQSIFPSSAHEVTDSQGRLWMSTGSYFSCYTPELECISRHRLKGEIYNIYRNENGQTCVLTFQRKRYIIRVYRFS